MIKRTNKYFLICAILLFLICFVILHYMKYIQKDMIAIVILEGALFLLFYKKRKWWAFWCCFVLLFYWGVHTTLPFINKHIFGTVLVLLGGCFLLYQYAKTDWESYVTGGCFGISFGIFGLTVYLPFFKENICILLLLCLAMVWYTSSNIKKRKKTIYKIWLEALTVFAVILAFLYR
ncbi:hypothetical protein [Clostridium sp. MD294]|uniref:hypothetical protein n=1 Tax=Clostridium sp. MD294 TaxID=97138 RepID=UPI0002CBA19B|nr:hypothetical protein [Clostridium sp. MD294]NDO47217.1 hypothetical protein [Clostridium sp. MD294]USF29718.1 hypothetical protein C820_001120 [Clostridium sp. MD294]